MPLYLTHVLRPLTIRFTEPGVADLSLDLNSFTHVRTSTDIHDPDDAVPVDPVLFDVVVEQNAHPQRKHSVGSDAKRSREQRARALIEARAQETVRDVKRIVRSDRPAIHRRRIRLIHAGRILRDGIRLVSYFDQLDSHRKASVRSLGSSLALGDDDNDGEDRAEDDEDGHAARTTTEVVPLRELLPDYWQSLPNSSGGGKGKGKAKASSDDDDDDDGDVSGGEDGSGDLGGVQVCVARKLHERIYVQCSVGDVMDSEEEARERGLIDVAPSSPPHLDIDDTGPSPSSADQDRSAPPAQGFDRLLSTGLTPEEVASIRAQFRSSALPVSGDVLRQREEEEHARALEDAWFDSFSQDPAAKGMQIAVVCGLFAK
ncbi:uncharacterized protein PSFLO_03111 [Pseudozyma flocculosa]|uniref:Ubiquitin-like domain-containing protein n=1 Tax=Pseudozyma flocculosa TaxID=84751 RepID=A0A5C3F128_9BASI|nr:uncharacterized protein PSFLO_03111 [Pseudozyma flocculosa]